MPRDAIKTELDDINALDELHNNWICLPKREIWIRSTAVDLVDPSVSGIEPGVEFMMATKVIMNIRALTWLSSEEPIVIHLQTCGGMFEDGMAIYDMIRSLNCRVIMINYTHARSMSSIILQAADVRFMMPHSHFMFHEGSMGVEGEMRTTVSNVEFYRKFGDKCMIDAYYDRVKDGAKFRDKKYWTENRVKKYLKDQMYRHGDVFLQPEEAIEWGFADSILTSWQDVEDAKREDYEVPSKVA